MRSPELPITSERAEPDRVQIGFDPDDIFGIRRALAMLPEHQWDGFFARWTELCERCDYDLVCIRADADDEAERFRGVDDRRAGAWRTISGAMRAYFVWRARSRPGPGAGTPQR